jgi:hypothetical protein
MKIIEEEALEYSNNDKQRAKDYLAGYLSSIKNPHTRTIRLLTIYVMDFVPYFRKHPSYTNMVTQIRDIFRRKLYPKELFQSD